MEKRFDLSMTKINSEGCCYQEHINFNGNSVSLEDVKQFIIKHASKRENKVLNIKYKVFESCGMRHKLVWEIPSWIYR